ncbi:MAG: T9SS type A sorting domain-containing protein [Bacteroidales bacterium]|nr:T9SS type A sorting domain-containing protein [Bacteroidales bacterium]
MKKFVLTVVALLITGSLSAQNVTRECVLFEIYTGVNCPYCPAAANGIMDMLEEGYNIAPVAFHDRNFSVPEFYTDETEARKNLYGSWVSGYPTSICDGVSHLSGGGGASETLFNTYRNWYNQRINVMSPYTIELSYQYLEGSTCQVTAVVNKVGECSAANMRLVIALTESHIDRAWQGMSELNAVTRDLIPTQNGTTLTSDSQVVTETFSMEGFPKENMLLVAWVQSWTTKEVFQTVKLPMAMPDLNNDVALRGIDALVADNCSGFIQPILEVKACGKENVTSMEIETRDANGQVLNTYNWSGNAAQGETILVNMDEYSIGDASSLEFVVTKVNGSTDDAAFDNSQSRTLGTAKDMDGTIYFQLKTPKNPEEMIIDVEDMQTGEVIEHYTFDEGGKTYKFYAYLPTAGCYRLQIMNPNGTGCGTGYGQIKDNSGQTIVNFSNNNNVYTYRLGVEMHATAAAVGENSENASAVVYPNPVSSQININAENIIGVEIYNAAGQMVYSSDAEASYLVIDAGLFDDGLYLINIKNADGTVSSQKIVIKK